MSSLEHTPYTGADSLEVMEEAVNYNAYLLRLVTREARIGDAVLDFGAGIGTFARRLADQGYKIICLEPDAAQRAKVAAAGLTAVADLGSVPESSLDFIYSLNVLEHIEDDVGAATALRRRLRRGGKALIYVPAFPLLYGAMDRKVGHVRRYRRAGLAKTLQAAGFVIERMTYADCLGFFATLVFNRVGSADGTINRGGLIAFDRLAFPVSRILDRATAPFFGKNLVAVAHRPRDEH
jgi:SAM-dependent methyltransferase